MDSEQLIKIVLEQSNKLINNLLDTVYKTCDEASTEIDGIKVLPLVILEQVIDAVKEGGNKAENGEHISTI